MCFDEIESGKNHPIRGMRAGNYDAAKEKEENVGGRRIAKACRRKDMRTAWFSRLSGSLRK